MKEDIHCSPFFISSCLLKFERQNLQSNVRRMPLLIRIKDFFQSPFPAITHSSWSAADKSPSTWCSLCASLTSCLAYQSCTVIIQPIQRLQSTKVVRSLIFLTFQHRFLYWIPTNKQTTNNSLTHLLTIRPTDRPTNQPTTQLHGAEPFLRSEQVLV